jgi:hypothetical protein
MGDDFKNGNRLMEKEKSDQFNADLERLRSGRGPDIRRDGKQIEPPFALRVSARLGQMLSDGDETKETLKKLTASGLTADRAQLLMRTALHYCMVESNSGAPDRWPAVMLALREGRTLEELFPDAFYSEPHGFELMALYEVPLQWPRTFSLRDVQPIQRL